MKVFVDSSNLSARGSRVPLGIVDPVTTTPSRRANEGGGAREAARRGADICTCLASVIEARFKHPLTDIGLATCLEEWEQAYPVKA